MLDLMLDRVRPGARAPVFSVCAVLHWLRLSHPGTDKQKYPKPEEIRHVHYVPCPSSPYSELVAERHPARRPDPGDRPAHDVLRGEHAEHARVDAHRLAVAEDVRLPFPQLVDAHPPPVLEETVDQSERLVRAERPVRPGGPLPVDRDVSAADAVDLVLQADVRITR